MNAQVLDYYTKRNCITDPGEHAAALDVLPSDLAELHAAMDGFLVHIWKVQTYHPHLPEGRAHEVFIRHTRRVLEGEHALDSTPLDVQCPVEKRLIIDCRHFAVVLCAVLRHREIPAHARCGFATYLEDAYYMDHWVCEYWNAEEDRWVMEDADKRMHDVPREQFITGARAWQTCRRDASQGDLFGFGPDMRGAWVARVNLVREFAALNGFESVSGDGWGLAMTIEEI